jgi:hypothetical protein
MKFAIATFVDVQCTLGLLVRFVFRLYRISDSVHAMNAREEKKPSVKMPSYTLHEGANVRCVGFVFFRVYLPSLPAP